MATNNLFLGTGKGSVGDVVLYRRNGKQTARVRIRDVANPQTQAQATQRAVFAPVARFYAPLSQILETAWEGMNKSESYTAFLKRNVALARQNSWLLPKDFPLYPFPYEVSHGSVRPLEYFYVDEGFFNLLVGSDPNSTGDNYSTTLAALTRRLMTLGYMEGDQITFIFCFGPSVPSDTESPTWFVSHRFILSLSSTEDIFDVFSSDGVDSSYRGSALILSSGDNYLAGMAVVVSRYENGMWRRSTQSMALDGDYLSYISSESNVATSIRSYMRKHSAAQSTIYLNGGSGGSQSSLGLMRIVTRSIPEWGSPVILERELFEYGSQSVSNAAMIVYTALNGSSGYGAWPVVRLVDRRGDEPVLHNYLITVDANGQWGRTDINDVNLIVEDGGYVLLGEMEDSGVATNFMLKAGMPAALLTVEGIQSGE